MCTLTPKTTRVRVDYTGVIAATIEPDGSVDDFDGPAALNSVITIQQLLERTQSLTGSVVGDQWTAMLAPLGWGSPKTLELAVC